MVAMTFLTDDKALKSPSWGDGMFQQQRRYSAFGCLITKPRFIPRQSEL